MKAYFATTKLAPVDTGLKLNINLNVLCMFNLRPVCTGACILQIIL